MKKGADMKITEEAIINEINKMARKACQYYQNNGGKWDTLHTQNMNEIHGAMRVLEAVTGKMYVINENGTIAERGDK